VTALREVTYLTTNEGGYMKTYLIQHAEAMSEEQDPNRPLNDLGREHAEAVAAVATRLGVEVGQIRHSGKTRAEQTAEILGQALAPPQGVVAVSGLSPLDDVEPVAQELEQTDQPLMLVGHLPFMERLAGHMLAGDAERAVIDFTNAGIVCLEKEDGPWQAVWILTPEMARR
jgi:phosphohistidine phosphatase